MNFFDYTKDQQKNYLINSMKKLEFINEEQLNKNQQNEILTAKNEIVNQLEKLKTNNELDKESIIAILEIIQKYSKYIRNEYYL